MISDEQFNELASKVDGITSVLQRLADESGKAAFMEKHNSKWGGDEGIGEAIYGEIQGMEKGEDFDEDKVIIDMLTSLKADTDALAGKLARVEELIAPVPEAPQPEAPQPEGAEPPVDAPPKVEEVDEIAELARSAKQ